MRGAVVVFLLLIISSTLCTEDYYELLGISRDADSKDIRRAFKKLALKYHPDKNPGSGAHEKFTKINRAYEVLKDDELRKKYDLYGEEGLKDNHFSGHYQSWNFFNEEFGIYDEDKEIITLSYSDFEASVKGTDDVWFINFYSPFCHHCHEIAPIWREVARDLEGVIRMGAVNCQEDWAVCQEQGIPSYPSLIFYPKMEVYSGPRTTHEMVQYILNSLDVTIHPLTAEGFDGLVADDNNHQIPWIICFCSRGEDCLSDDVVTKLAAVLANMVNVGTLDCDSEASLCELLGQSAGVVYYPAGQVNKETAVELDSLDGRELVNLALQALENLVLLDEDSFREARWKSSRNQDYPWLVHFALGKMDNLEMRKLPALLPEMNVGHVDCTEFAGICRDLHLRKYPAVALFKTDGYEWNHGRYTAHDIAVFARESLTSNVRTLEPEDFPQVVMSSHEQWFIDFFAPWCPPCMRLLPEWRKAARTFTGKGVHFGTVDCTIHSTLCHQYGIQSYPTTIFYNNSIPHKFMGQHSSEDLVDFVETTMNPAVVALEPDSFAKLVENRKRGHTWIVDFYAPWCGPCNELHPEWNKLAKKTQKETSNVHVGSVDCQEHRFFCQQHGVQSYPTIRLYPYDSQGATHFHFHRGWRDVSSLFSWSFQYLPTLVLDVYTHTFQQQVLENERPWVVDFYAPWCGHCVSFAPTFAKLAKLLEGKVYAGKVNCDSDPHICSQAGVRAYPTVKLYLGSTERMVPQHIAGSMELYTAHSAEELKNIVMSEVEHRQSQLDELKRLKSQQSDQGQKESKSSPGHDEF